MIISKLRISNWKSFEHTQNPAWIEFNKLNIFIGPNSHGKTNLANALRLICDYDPDYGGNPNRNRKKVKLNDFNIENQCIEIEAITDYSDDSIIYKIDPNYPELFMKCNFKFKISILTKTLLRRAIFYKVLLLKYLTLLLRVFVHNSAYISEDFSVSKSIKNIFFPIGSDKKIFEIGINLDNNWEILQKHWSELKEEMLEFFHIKLQDAPPENKSDFLSDLLDENNQVFYLKFLRF